MTARIGIVGIGWWATLNHIPTIQADENADVVAICDFDENRLKIAGDKFGIPSRYSDLSDMLAVEKLDGVIVSTPHITHTGPTIAALEAGCHVLVEKPMATTSEDGWSISAAAKKVGKEVIVATGLNFSWFSQIAENMVSDGRIGEVRHVICQMGSALDDLFSGNPMEETSGHLFRPPASTWSDPKRAGGYGWGQMSHSLGWLFYVSNLRFKSICCIAGNSISGVDIYDAAIARATNGATISLSGSASVPKHIRMNMDVRIYGTEGMIVFDTDRARLELRRHDRKDELIPISLTEADYDGKLPVKVFSALCAGHDIVNAANAENGARVTEAIAALYKSVETGKFSLICD